MKPADLRNATWSQVLTHVTKDMQRVHAAWRVHGPGTTKQVARRAGISLLTFRPRTTDLYQLGLVECTSKVGTAGVYDFRSEASAEASAAWKEDRTPRKERRAKNPRAVPASFEPTDSQIRWAAQIMSRAAMTRRRMTAPSASQSELFPVTPGHAA